MNKKKLMTIASAFLFIVFIISFNYVGCGAASSSSGSSGTYTPKTQMIWKNGSPGAWNGDALTAAIAITTAYQETTSSVAVTDNVSGGTPSLQLISADSYTESFQFRINNVQDCSEFNYGHLQFNMRLESTNIIGITVNASNGTFTDGQNVALSVGAFNTSQFTHASIPLSSIFSNRFSTIRCVMILKITRNPRINGESLVTINDVKWTTD